MDVFLAQWHYCVGEPRQSSTTRVLNSWDILQNTDLYCKVLCMYISSRQFVAYLYIEIISVLYYQVIRCHNCPLSYPVNSAKNNLFQDVFHETWFDQSKHFSKRCRQACRSAILQRYKCAIFYINNSIETGAITTRCKVLMILRQHGNDGSKKCLGL